MGRSERRVGSRRSTAVDLRAAARRRTAPESGCARAARRAAAESHQAARAGGRGQTAGRAGPRVHRAAELSPAARPRLLLAHHGRAGPLQPAIDRRDVRVGGRRVRTAHHRYRPHRRQRGRIVRPQADRRSRRIPDRPGSGDGREPRNATGRLARGHSVARVAARPDRRSPREHRASPSSGATTRGSAAHVTASLSAAPTTTRPPQDDQVNILLVDDRAENLLALEGILEPLGERLVRAHSGDEALKCLLTEEFAVILLDVQMPGLNGFETAEMIKSRERTRYVPIIFLTAISKDEAYVGRGYSVGAVDYMSKPFQPDVLRSKVSVFVDLYRKQRQLKRQERLLREAAVRQVELEHRTQLLAQEEKTAQIVGAAMDAILVLDADRPVTLFNAAAERLFGRAGDAVVGRLAREGIRGPPLAVATKCAE